MPRASAAAAALTAQEILDAAIDLFAANGFATVSLDDVARAAGVTRGAVYHHYRSKTGLFRAVAERIQGQVAAAVVAAVDGEQSAAERLRSGSHAFLDAITAAPAVRILLVDAPSVIGWEEWRRLDAENSGTHLREALGDAGVPAEIVEALTAQLSGAMNEAVLWIAQHEAPEAARAQAHAALDRLIAAVVTVQR